MNEVARPGESEVVPAPMPGAQPIVLRPDEGAPPPPAPAGRRGLSPLNRRRLDNFRRNRLGYGSFLIFAGLFILSLFAEFIANDRPILLSYKGEWLVPVLVDYPEEKFGGFLAQTDYRSPEIRKEIAENGWALWPPIRFSYDTINEDLPTPSPSPPTWMLSDAQCRPVAEKLGGTSCADIPWHWLGTDNTTRDVLARVIYGFRISVLFGLILA
ncbi:MAG: ABC transporter permease, partial [Hyphomicrobiales bacterium]